MKTLAFLLALAVIGAIVYFVRASSKSPVAPPLVIEPGVAQEPKDSTK